MSNVDSNRVTLKDDQVFLVSLAGGDILDDVSGQGLYYHDMRYLSLLALDINDMPPNVLSYTADYNLSLVSRLSNQTFQLQSLPDTTMAANEASFVPTAESVSEMLAPRNDSRIYSHTIGVARRRFIKDGLREVLDVTNYYTHTIPVSLTLTLGSDFRDLFDIRGFPRPTRGQVLSPQVEADGRRIALRYIGVDGVERTTRVEISPTPTSVEVVERTQSGGLTIPAVVLRYTFSLEPRRPTSIRFSAMPDELTDGHNLTDFDYATEVSLAARKFTDWRSDSTHIETDNPRLNAFFETSINDLRSLMTRTPDGLSITAGLPWYFTLFGRDSIITALQTLMLNPQVAVDILRSLAALQADKIDDWRDAEPGKILHEMRYGEMVAAGEVPHNPYYGTADATPLFALLFGEVFRWLDDRAIYDELLPNVRRALEWCDTYGDLDGDGFVEYNRRSKMGILQQGWKDSDESLTTASGQPITGNIALCEIQGYVYAAKIRVADVAEHYGDGDYAAALREQAAILRAKFNRDFWDARTNFIAQALDTNKQPIGHVTSNPGHCLYAGIVDETPASRVAKRLATPDMLSGWGLRTVSAHDAVYNPMSYHNGSIWPHDNSIVAAGLIRYGFLDEAEQVIGQLFEAALHFDDYRLPELYCGFDRESQSPVGPATYPVSCSPQAWAAGAPILLLQAMLGLEADAAHNRIVLRPRLPESLPVEYIILRNLRLGNSRIDLKVRRETTPSGDKPISVEILRSVGGAEITIRS